MNLFPLGIRSVYSAGLAVEGASPYRFELAEPALANQTISGIIPTQVKAISIHHPLLSTSCNLRMVTHKEGNNVPNETIK